MTEPSSPAEAPPATVGRTSSRAARPRRRVESEVGRPRASGWVEDQQRGGVGPPGRGPEPEDHHRGRRRRPAAAGRARRPGRPRRARPGPAAGPGRRGTAVARAERAGRRGRAARAEGEQPGHLLPRVGEHPGRGQPAEPGARVVGPDPLDHVRAGQARAARRVGLQRVQGVDPAPGGQRQHPRGQRLVHGQGRHEPGHPGPVGPATARASSMVSRSTSTSAPAGPPCPGPASRRPGRGRPPARPPRPGPGPGTNASWHRSRPRPTPRQRRRYPGGMDVARRAVGDALDAGRGPAGGGAADRGVHRGRGVDRLGDPGLPVAGGAVEPLRPAAARVPAVCGRPGDAAAGLAAAAGAPAPGRPAQPGPPGLRAAGRGGPPGRGRHPEHRRAPHRRRPGPRAGLRGPRHRPPGRLPELRRAGPDGRGGGQGRGRGGGPGLPGLRRDHQGGHGVVRPEHPARGLGAGRGPDRELRRLRGRRLLPGRAARGQPARQGRPGPGPPW